MSSLRSILLITFKKRHTIPVLLILLAVIFANSIYLFTSASPNPVLQRAGLSTSLVKGRLSGQNTIDPNDGFTSQALGHLAAEDWLHGTVPYWNYYEGTGAPLAGEMQSASFFPLTLVLAFSNGLLYFHVILEAIAGIATYFLLIRLRFSRKVAIFGGVAFALNGTFAWLTNAAFNPIAFLPLILLGIEVAYESVQKNKKRGWLLISLGIALSIYSGFPETAYIDGLLCGAWALIRIFQLHKDNRKKFIHKLLSGLGVGLLLSLPILVMFYDYLKYANVGIHASSGTAAALNPIGLSSLIMPYIYGPIFGQYSYDATGALGGWWGSVGGYISASMLAVAIIGTFGKKDRPLRIMLAAWTLLVVGRVYGFFDLSNVFNLIPGIKSTAFFRYSQPSFEFCLVVLAAFGIRDLVKNRASVKVRIGAAFAMAVILTAAIIRSIPELENLRGAPHRKWWAVLSIALAIGTTVLIFATQLLNKVSLKEKVLIAIILFEVGMTFILPQLSTPRHVKLDVSPVTYLQKNLNYQSFYTLGPIQPNYGSFYKITSIDINDLPIPKTYTAYVNKNLDGNVNPLIFTGTTMTNPNGTTPVEAFVKNFSKYEFTGVKYLVAPNNGLITSKDIVATGIRRVFSTSTVDIYELPNPAPYFQILDGSCSLNYTSRSSLTTYCKAPATLVRRELFMKGWSANINMRQVNLKSYAGIFQEINLPQGTSKIEFNYSPPHVTIAYFAFIVGLGLIVIPPVLSRRRD